jgi:hypothetical protein
MESCFIAGFALTYVVVQRDSFGMRDILTFPIGTTTADKTIVDVDTFGCLRKLTICLALKRKRGGCGLPWVVAHNGRESWMTLILEGLHCEFHQSDPSSLESCSIEIWRCPTFHRQTSWSRPTILAVVPTTKDLCVCTAGFACCRISCEAQIGDGLAEMQNFLAVGTEGYDRWLAAGNWAATARGAAELSVCFAVHSVPDLSAKEARERIPDLALVSGLLKVNHGLSQIGLHKQGTCMIHGRPTKHRLACLGLLKLLCC